MLKNKSISSSDKPFVYTGGTFDVFHAGHADFLKKSSYLGNVIVAVNRDEFVKKYKGKFPANSLEERISVLKSCKYVYDVIVNIYDEESDKNITSYPIIPNYITIGSDWLTKDYSKQTGFSVEFLENFNITLVYIPRVINLSSTQIKTKIKNEN